jgi:hypothetical protein
MEWVDISDSARGDIAFFAVIDDFQTAFKLLDLTPKRLLQVPLKTRGVKWTPLSRPFLIRNKLIFGGSDFE